MYSCMIRHFHVTHAHPRTCVHTCTFIRGTHLHMYDPNCGGLWTVYMDPYLTIAEMFGGCSMKYFLSV